MRVKLGDICERGSSNLKQSDVIEATGEYAVYGAAGFVNNVDFYHQDKPYVAVVKDGAGVGRTMLLPAYSSVIGTMQYLLPKEGIMPEYLYYLVKSKHLEKYVMGAAIPHIYFKDYQKEEFELFDKEKQKEVVFVLQNIETIIENKNRELNLLDELVKSRFIELFGKGLDNDGRHPLKKISEIGKVVSGATPKTAKEEYWDGENLWITPAELNDSSFYINDSVRKITDAGVNSCAVNLLPKGTVILSSRAPIGKVAIVDKPLYCNQGFKNIIPNDQINSVYLYELLKMETDYLNSLGRGATFKEISKQIVENIEIKVPPVELQNQFAEFVEKVDKSKFVIQQSLENYQQLLDSLMQKYFG